MSAYKQYGYKPQRHWSDNIKGAICNGCICMEVLPRKHKWVEYEEYYCSWRHEIVRPEVMDCGHRREV